MRLGCLLLLLLVAITATAANAQPGRGPAATPAPVARIVALTPLSALGDERTRKELSGVTQQLVQALAKPGTRVIGPDAVSEAIRKSKRGVLRDCLNELSCLVEIGQLVAATHIIAAEVGGLGAAQVVGLRLIDVAQKSELRATTLEVGASQGGGAQGAVARLLEPSRFVGKLAIDVTAQGANIYVNGRAQGRSPAAPFELPVGTHALRVTHPEFRDFVRFVDVEFAATTTLRINLQRVPIVANQVVGKPAANQTVTWIDPPWYRRWYVVAAAGALAFGIGAALAYDAAPDYDYVREPK